MVRVEHIIELSSIASKQIFICLADGNSRHDKTSSYCNCVPYTVQNRISNLCNIARRIIAHECHTLIPFCLRADVLDCRRIEGRIVEDIERRPCLRGARIDVPRNMTWKDVWSIEGYPTLYGEELPSDQCELLLISTGKLRMPRAKLSGVFERFYNLDQLKNEKAYQETCQTGISAINTGWELHC